MARYKVIVDRDKCISCGVAPASCPEVFVLGEDNGKNQIVPRYEIEHDEHISIGIVPEELYDCVKAAAESCPTSAIKIKPLE